MIANPKNGVYWAKYKSPTESEITVIIHLFGGIYFEDEKEVIHPQIQVFMFGSDLTHFLDEKDFDQIDIIEEITCPPSFLEEC